VRLPCATHRNVYVRSEKAGRQVTASLTRFIEGRLKLQMNTEKSAVAGPWQRSFLGYGQGRSLVPAVHRRKGRGSVQTPGPRADAAAPGRQSAADGCRPEPVHAGLGRLLRLQPVARVAIAAINTATKRRYGYFEWKPRIRLTPRARAMHCTDIFLCPINQPPP